MSFPTYSRYKHSGIEVLGEFPDHWTLKRFKNVFLERLERSSDGSEDLLSVSAYFGIKPRSETLDEGDHLSRAESLEGYKVCQVGDLVINIMLAWNRGLGFAWQRGIVSPAYCVFYVTDGSVPKFLDYLVRSDECIRYFKTHSAGIMDSRLRLYPESFGRLFTAIPPAGEQIQIARFLDYETARIDALIEEQQRLIELLKEKRQAVISHAITKGLDPTVPMKDSGVEWLGEVPVHWDVCSARRVICAIEQGWSPECEANPAAEDAWGILKAGCVNRGVFDPSENKTLPASLEPITEYEVRAGDILMSRASGSPELVGSTALLGEVRERLMLSDKIFRIHLEENVSSSFFVWVMNAQFMRAQIEQALSGGNGLANNLPQASLLAFLLAVPPSNEQDAIADFIDGQIRRLDAMISEGDTGIGLLQERRSALISAAVTGKIDVRGWRPATEKSAQHRKTLEV
ncbi:MULTISPECIES: restriction endonuclease subunit S [unclassified Pseudomonas]|uniref:restriction endonuclease subunit S n=1 Tax=unclassified Pseudomonas TaxID=196821 RepID=UPI000BD36E5F|nr:MULTISPECIES: restriction endonuclease subunit S [unclassified Pseudomonas]PVZ15359.1 type I restriction enzyme S subunit [Pseudomonas sp. URIL14HWK12:I12]PVZ24733.1 type I restriction enzyme S subunit [Pseudomonas sp. URIL14HWK12:I10]PVZ34578.1 type I restriction enzyme S subunit [Pseudomonas sp. URIL14HWK12:I11]SNZ08709.1 type I restriction enzyme, S subunit [Pseudomonas sp. URIL14HWK12:I9]